MERHFIAWWNVENLFDVENSAVRPDWLARTLRSELKGWTASVLNRKIDNLGSVIAQMNNGAGPDILGVCEVENEAVLRKLTAKLKQLLPTRNYEVIHHDASDHRGIDVAFIYDDNRYLFDQDAPGSFFSYEVRKRYATRDIVQATIKTRVKGNELILIGNHWPSRSGGQYSSEPYRMIAGETLSYWIERIQEIKGSGASIIAMGDFNDEPYNRSLTQYGLSTIDRNKVVYGRNPYLFNLTWPILGKRTASYSFNSEPSMIDQILVAKGIAKKSGTFVLESDAARVEVFEGMTSGRYDVPVRFGRPSAKLNEEGYSDHLPISFVLKE